MRVKFQKVKWKGVQVSKKMHNTAIEGLRDALEHILGEANKIVPHDEGNLQRDSGIELDKAKLQGAVWYGKGPAASYAKRLHEHPEYNFQKGREGKWLEKTFNQEEQKVLEFIANRLKKEMM